MHAVVLIVQAAATNTFCRKILEVYNEATKALIFFVGNQPQFILECVKAVLELAKHPICVCSFWSATIVAVITGLAFVYDWEEELNMVCAPWSDPPIFYLTLPN